jgi:hypothetical protein
MSKASIRVAHSTQGRIRLKVRHGKGNPEVLNAVAESFRGIPGIEHVEINPITGGVILTYDPDRHIEFVGHVERTRAQAQDSRPPETDIDRFASTIQKEAEFLAEHSAGARVFVDFCKRLDRDVKVASNNNVDLKLMLAAGVVAATVLEVGATAATPVWVTLLLFGANHFIELHQKGHHAPNAVEDRI